MPKTKLLLLLVLASACLYPQAFSGSLTGLVTDPNSAVVPNAAVRIQNKDTQESRQTVSGGDGRYVFSQISPGVYNLTVEASGFKKFSSSEFTIRANQAAELNAAMVLGQVTDTIEVATTAAQLDTQSANQSFTMDRQQILNLPASTRNPFVAVHAMAGVTSMSVAQSNAPADQNVARFAFNGGRDMSGLVLIDGIPATAGDWGGLLASPSVESVQEVQVSRNSYDAEFGKSGGGVVSVVTKGGSNQFHGSAFEFLRNDNLDANAWANNRAGRPRVEFKRHQFGGNLSGPLWKSKRLYFLSTYEALKQGSPATTNPTVPTDLERAGNFSNTRNLDGNVALIFDPFTTRPNPSGPGFVRDAFAGNIIPRNRFDAVGARVVELYPRANTTPTNAITQANNFFGAGSSITNNWRLDQRVDWAKSEKLTMYGRITYAEQEGVSPRFFGTGGDTGSEGTAPRYHATFGLTYVPSPKLVMNFTMGSGRWREESLPVTLRDGVLGTTIGLPAATVAAMDSQHMPQFNVTGYSALSNGRILNFPRRTDNAQLNATREFGAHSLKFGFGAENAYLNSIDIRSADFAFDRGMTSGPTAAISSAVSGNSIASLLLGTGIGAAATGSTGGVTAVNNAITNRVQPAPLIKYYSAYVQDVWRLSSRLTLNFGVRYEQQRPRTERYNRYNYFDYNARNPLSDRTGLDLRGGLVFVDENNRGQTQLDAMNFAPRFGFAYKVNSRIVARGGYGIFYLQACCNALQGGPAAGTDGFTVTTNWATSRGGDGITPQDLLANPFPNGVNRPVGSSLGLLTQAGGDVTAVQRSRPTGYTQNFSYDLQFELGRGSVLEVGYSGVLGRKLNVGGLLNVNQLPSQLLSLGAALNDPVRNPFAGFYTTGVFAGTMVPRHRLLRPHPHFNTVELNGDTPGATSSFNALYLKYNKSFSGGLTVLTSYQFSKNIDDASENQGWIINERFRDVNNRSLDRSISAHDVPHSFAGTLLYTLPVGKGRKFGGSMNRVADAVVGGWELATTVRLASGLPMRLEAPNTLATYGFSIQNASVADMNAVSVSNPTPSRWFNTAAVAAPQAFTLGNAPRFAGNLRAGATRHADVNLAKNFSLTERFRLQFRVEAYNLTNTPQFAPPGLTVGNADFGQVNNTRFNDRRIIQLGLKLLF
jgi:hypothetical protein